MGIIERVTEIAQQQYNQLLKQARDFYFGCPPPPTLLLRGCLLLSPPPPPPLGLVPVSESHAKCVNQRAGKYRLSSERAWEGNVTPAVTLEQKKQAVASLLSTPSVQSNKDGVRMSRRSGRQKATLSPRNMAGAQVVHTQAE